jgi:hypothetical protein
MITTMALNGPLSRTQCPSLYPTPFHSRIQCPSLLSTPSHSINAHRLTQLPFTLALNAHRCFQLPRIQCPWLHPTPSHSRTPCPSITRRRNQCPSLLNFSSLSTATRMKRETRGGAAHCSRFTNGYDGHGGGKSTLCLKQERRLLSRSSQLSAALVL